MGESDVEAGKQQVAKYLRRVRLMEAGEGANRSLVENETGDSENV